MHWVDGRYQIILELSLIKSIDEHNKIGQNDDYAHNENKMNLALGHLCAHIG